MRSGTTDYKILSFGTPQHATVIKVSRPEGAVVVANVKTDSSRHCLVQAPEGPIQPHSSPYHGSHSPQDRTGLAGGTLSGEDSSLLSLLWLLQAREAAPGNGGGLHGRACHGVMWPWIPIHGWCTST